MTLIHELLYFNIRPFKEGNSDHPKTIIVRGKPIIDGKIRSDVTISVILSGMVRKGFAIFSHGTELEQAMVELSQFVRSQPETAAVCDWEMGSEFCSLFYPFDDHRSIEFGDHDSVLSFEYPFAVPHISKREFSTNFTKDSKNTKFQPKETRLLGLLGDDEEIVRSFVSQNMIGGVGVINFDPPIKFNSSDLENTSCSFGMVGTPNNCKSPLIAEYHLSNNESEVIGLQKPAKNRSSRSLTPKFEGKLSVQGYQKKHPEECIVGHLKAVTIRAKFFTNHKTQTSEAGVIMIGDKLLLRQFPGIPVPKFMETSGRPSSRSAITMTTPHPIVLCRDEGELLVQFLRELSSCDPDVVLGYKLVSTDLKILADRMQVLKILPKSHVGTSRATRDFLFVPGKYSEDFFTSGRLVCDVYDFATKNVPGLKFFTLADIFYNTYGKTCVPEENGIDLDVTNDNYFGVFRYFCEGERGFHQLYDLMKKECHMCQEIENYLSILKLAEKVSEYASVPLDHALSGNKTVIGEFIFLREFQKRGILVPPVSRGKHVKKTGSTVQRNPSGNGSKGNTQLPTSKYPQKSKSHPIRLVGEKRARDGCTLNSTAKVNVSLSSKETGQISLQDAVKHSVRSPSSDDIDQEKTLQTSKTKSESLYAGGLILDVIPGLYSGKLKLLDVESLYPSIVMLLKLCFTTPTSFGKSKSHIASISYSNDDGKHTPPSYGAHPKGFLFEIFSEFVTLRREAKKKIVSVGDSNSIEEKALKILINAVYGILGRPSYRFSRVDIASLITAHGRALLNRGIEIVLSEKPTVKLLYGHTDSLLISIPEPLLGDNGMDTTSTSTDRLTENGKINQVYRVAENYCLEDSILKRINSYNPLIRMKVDGSFSQCIILAKNSYISWSSVTGNIEFKGTEAQSRSSFQVMSECFGNVARLIFRFYSDLSLSSKGLIYLAQQIGSEISHTIDSLPRRYLHELVMTMKLGKSVSNPQSRGNSSIPHHVRVAQSLRALGAIINEGDMIQYVACISRTGSPMYCHPFVLVKDSISVSLNYGYYANRIRQAIKKMCISVNKNLGELLDSFSHETETID